MLDITFIREHTEKVRAALKQKNVADVAIDRLLELDQNRRRLLGEVERRQAEQNLLSDSIGKAKARGDKDALAALMAKAVDIKVEIQQMQPDLEFTQREYDELLLRVPNVPTDDVPVGASEQDNVIIREVWFEGDEVHVRRAPYTLAEEHERQFAPPWPHQSAPRDYMEIAQKLDWIDTERASKISGTRFGYIKREAALMEFALVQLAFRTLIREGFIPVVPPAMIRPDVLTKMARLSEIDRDERYYMPVDDLYLAGSAEHTLGPMHMDETLKEEDLPLRYVGFSTSFRREAGSYGKDTHGIIRVHQFDKIEMESFSAPEKSFEEQEFFVALQERLMQALHVPYRVVMIATGDMGRPDARQIDLEAWMPGQGRYRETHTADLMTDYQSRRLNTKVRCRDGRLEFAHMNDATVFAIGRTLVAIIENYQQPDGTVAIPEALKPFMS